MSEQKAFCPPLNSSGFQPVLPLKIFWDKFTLKIVTTASMEN